MLTEHAITRIREALEPLAYLYGMIEDQDDKPDTAMFFQHDAYTITYGDIRRARALLRELSLT